MASPLYDELLSAARELLAELGQPAILRRSTGGSYDPVKGEHSGASVEEFRASAVVLDYSHREVDGSTVLRGDRKVILEAVERPREGDSLVLGGQVWSMVSFSAVDPAGVALVYELQVRA